MPKEDSLYWPNILRISPNEFSEANLSPWDMSLLYEPVRYFHLEIYTSSWVWHFKISTFDASDLNSNFSSKASAEQETEVVLAHITPIFKV